MPEIGLHFNEKNFEYDVYTLVKAFYPGAKIISMYEGEEKSDISFDINIKIQYSKDAYVIIIDEKGKDARVSSTKISEALERSELKNVLKQLLYKALSAHLGVELPWGDLTGIRPVKIPMKLMEEGYKNSEIAKILREKYFISNKKCALSIAVANREKAILDSIDAKNGYSLYVGIPFCPTICLYCSFSSHPLERFKKMVEPYLLALHKELEFIAKQMKDYKLTSIYIGGGTPTSLSAKQLDELLTVIEDNFSLENVVEFTVEAGRPDTITEDKLYALKAHAVSRISINPQTMNDKTLELIGRGHTVAQVKEAFKMAREIGFDNINMDLIAGLPGEGEEEIRTTIEDIRDLDPDSVTVHSLAIKRSSRLHEKLEEYKGSTASNTDMMMDAVGECAAKMMMQPYYLYRQKNIAGNLENVGYAKEGCFGIYNILIMEEKQTILAAGSGAISKFVYEDGRIERSDNVKDIHNYVERIDEMLERKKTALANYFKQGDN